MSSSGISSQQAAAILKRHARDDIAPLRLQELCRDNDRVSSLVSVYNPTPDRMLLVDISRQRMTNDTLNHLMRLANARQLRKYITRLAWGGQNDPENPIILQNGELNQGNKLAAPAGMPRTKSTRFNNDGTISNSNSNDGSHDRLRGHGSASHHAASSKSSFSATTATTATDKNNHGSGANNAASVTDDIPSFHIALRVPADEGYQMLDANGNNVLNGIHKDWKRIKQVSDSIRRGQLPGATGTIFRDVVVVGRGVSIMALRFVYMALVKDEAGTIARRSGLTDPRRASSYGQRRIKFLTTCDPIRVAAVIADCDPASTLVISVSLTGTEETNLATQTLRNWLLSHLTTNGRRPDSVLSKHVILVTASDNVAANSKSESVFRIPSHSNFEPFLSFTSVTLLPLAIVFGWPVVEEFIKGAHNMDAHFVETNPRHNLPVLLALSDIWNDIYLGSSGRIVTPFTESLAAFPALCAIMESQTCTRRNDDNGSSMALAGTTTAMTPMTTTSRIATPPVVIDGGLHNIYDGVLYQTDRTLPTELVMTLDTQVTANAIGTIGKRNMMRVFDTQDALMCSLFAQADELAFGNEARDSDNVGLDGGSAGRYGGISESGRRRDSFDWGSAAKAGSDGDASLGNRSSTVLVCSKCDAFMCGQLVAMVEHRVIVKARILGIDPFVRHVGSSFREKRTEQLREELRSIMEQDTIDEDEDDDGDGHGSGGTGNGMNLSTKTILQYYANLMKQQRAFIVANNNASISSSSINSTSR